MVPTSGRPAPAPRWEPPPTWRPSRSATRPRSIDAPTSTAWAASCTSWCAGAPPHQDDDIIELFAKVAAGDYTPANQIRPDLPNEVSDAIDALLEVNRDHRASDCAGILEILSGSDRDVVTRPLQIADDVELPPPAPMPPAGVTMLEPGTPAATVAQQFVQRIVTPEPVDPSGAAAVAPHNPSRLDSGLDLQTGPTRALDAQNSSMPVRERTSFSAFAALGFAILAGVFLLVALLMTGVVVAQSIDWSGGDSDPDVTTLQPPVEPEPIDVTDPEPVDPQPDIEPDTVEPDTIKPDVEPDPSPSTAPGPSPVPSPVDPAPTPDPAPAPDPAPKTTGIVELEPAEGINRIVLTDASGITHDPGPLPPGRYEVLLFSDRTDGGTAGSITVREGKTTTVFCSLKMSQCRTR